MSAQRKRFYSLTALGVILVYFGLKLYRSPLDTYTWTELLINYAAGFIRRGLIGKIGYWVSPYISVKFFLSAVITLCYLFHLILFARITRGIHDAEWYLFVFSPAAFLFPIYDFDAYGRKDVFLIFIFLLTFLLILRKVRLRILLPVMFVLYQIGILIHEYALFYFPFAVLLIVVCYADQPRRETLWTLALAALFMLGNMVWLYALSKQHYELELIPASWEGLIPEFDLTTQSGALGWLGVPLREGLQPVFDKLSWPQTFFSYVFGMLLSLVPMALLNARCQILQTLRVRFADRAWLLWVCGFLLLCTLPIFIFSSDWGRLVYLYGFNLFTALVVLKERLGCAEPVARDVEADRVSALRNAALFVLFTGTWFLKMYVDGGNIALQQGLIFKILDWLAH